MLFGVQLTLFWRAKKHESLRTKMLSVFSYQLHLFFGHRISLAHCVLQKYDLIVTIRAFYPKIIPNCMTNEIFLEFIWRFQKNGLPLHSQCFNSSVG